MKNKFLPIERVLRSALLILLLTAVGKVNAQTYTPASLTSDANKAETVGIIPYSEDFITQEEVMERYYAITSFRMIDTATVAVLTGASDVILVYSLNQNRILYKIQLPISARAFDYDNNLFHVIGDRTYLTIDSEGMIRERKDFQRPQLPNEELFIITDLNIIDGRPIIHECNSNTYSITSDGLQEIDSFYYHHARGCKIRPQYIDENSLVLYSETSSKSGKHNVTMESLGLEGKLACLDEISVNDDFIAINLQTSHNCTGSFVKSYLLVVNLNGELINLVEVPINFLSYISKPFLYKDNAWYYAFSGQEGITFFKIGTNTNMLVSPDSYEPSDEEIDYSYHEPENGTSYEDRGSISGWRTITQAWYNGNQYRTLEWTPIEANIAYTCTWIEGLGAGSGNIKTPYYIRTQPNETKIGVPYKKAGFTYWQNFKDFAGQGKKTGNCYHEDNDECSGSPYSEVSDAYVIGVDCSGFVSRCWEFPWAVGTYHIPDYCTQYGNIPVATASVSDFQKGDALNWAGHHVMLYTGHTNGNSTITVFESSSDGFKTKANNYSTTYFTNHGDYKIQRLDLMKNIILRLYGEIELYQNGSRVTTVTRGVPLTVKYRVTNAGSLTWSGNVRLFIEQSTGTVVPLNPVYSTTLDPDETKLFTFSNDGVLSPEGPSKFYVRVQNGTINIDGYPVDANDDGYYYDAGSLTNSNPLEFNIVEGSGPSPVECKTCPEHDELWNVNNVGVGEWTTRSSSISTGGCRIYEVALESNYTYTFQTCNPGSASFNTWLYLLDEDCHLVEEDDDGCTGNLSSLQYTNTGSTAYYYLKIVGYNGAGGSFTIAAKRESAESPSTCNDCPDFDETWNVNNNVEVGEWTTKSSSIGTDGCYIYRVPLYSNYTYTFQTCNPGSASFDTWLYLLDANCHYVDDDDDGCGNNGLSSLQYTNTGSSAIYYLKIVGYNGAGGSFTIAGKRENTSTSYVIDASASPSAGGTVSGAGTYQSGSTCTLIATPNTGYTFERWTKNGNQVSTNPNYTFIVTESANYVAIFTTNSNGSGILNGVFSVGDNIQINFSQGNLQYQASTNSWRFAINQWDYVGDDNANIASNYSGWIDLFGWGTSGYNHGANCYQPWSSSTTVSDYYAYGSDAYNLYDQTGMADWGYNAISNGGNQTNNGWRTLTQSEWNYLMNTRSTLSGIRYALATLNGVKGLIMLPDDWNTSYYSLNNTNDDCYDYNDNIITSTQWTTLEQHGAVFLPAAGARNGTYVSNLQTLGYYWSASYSNTRRTYMMYFYPPLINSIGRHLGMSVRLVRPVQIITTFEINVTPNPSNGGTVSGGGAYVEGSTCTLAATANVGYVFMNWTENGEVISTEATYSFTVTGDRTLVANFTIYNPPPTPEEDLIAYYPFNGDANDYSGNDYHAMPCNNYQYENGMFGEAIAVVGQGYTGSSGGHVMLPELDFGNATGVTLNLWVKAQGLSHNDGEAYINFGYDNESDRLYIMHHPDQIRFVYHDAVISIPNEAGYIGNWMMYSLTCDENGSLKAYLNGILVGEESVTFNGINTSLAALGRHWWSGTTYTRFIGSFDEVRIYGRALSAQEVMQLYNSDNGCLPGIFSVGENVHVKFSQGNLQWSATGNGTEATTHTVADGGTAEGTWRFANHQYDYIGYDNNNVSSTYSGWIDIFGYGTSGWNSGATYYQPYSTAWSTTGYASGNLNGDMAYADWGVYNAISNGGDNPNLWRTLSQAEFRYLLNTRQTSTVCGIENARYAKAIINGTNGLILLPDNYMHPSNVPDLNNINISNAAFEDNQFPVDQWTTMELAGAVFLPAAGWRGQSGYVDENIIGRYRTTTQYDIMRSYTMQFHSDYVSAEEGWGNNAWGDKRDGHSVRLVKNLQTAIYSISAIPNPAEGGTVTGMGTYEVGSTCTMTAAANEGYTFMYWTENGSQVSSDANYSFVVTSSRNLVAHFALPFTVTTSVNSAEGGTVSFNTDFENQQIPSSWTNDATYPWVITTPEYAGYNGSFCMMSGNGGVHSSTSSIEVTVDFIQDGTVSFLAGCWGEGSSYIYDKCRFYIDEIEQFNYGALRAWDSYSYDVTAGTHTFRWSYSKDSSVHSEGDAFFVDDVKFTGAGFGSQFDYGQPCTLTATPNEGYLFLNWSRNGEVVSCNSTYSFVVTEEIDLEASFMLLEGTLIGEGEGTNVYLPSYSFWCYTLSQQIYTADEIGTAGSITSISYFNAGGTKTRNYDIYMVHTDKSTFDSNTDWITVSEADRVFSGEKAMTCGCWTTFVLDTPFAYNGTSNLAIIFDDNSGNWTGSPHMACRVFNSNGNQAIRIYSDDTNYDPYNPSQYGGTLHSVKNQIIFGITITQTTNLFQGSNWFSTYVDITLEDLQNALVEALPGATSITIKGRTQSSFYNGTRWRGALNSLDLALMYQITVPESCEITLEGMAVDPAQHPLTIKNGPNWIGFPFSESMTLDQAFFGFPISGDRIQSKSNGQATYSNRWRGALNTLVPGQGYIYQSNSAEDRVFTFPTGAK